MPSPREERPEAVEANLDLSERLWTLRSTVCPVPNQAAEPPISLVLKRMAQEPAGHRQLEPPPPRQNPPPPPPPEPPPDDPPLNPDPPELLGDELMALSARLDRSPRRLENPSSSKGRPGVPTYQVGGSR